MRFIFALLDPDPLTRLNPDPIRIRIRIRIWIRIRNPAQGGGQDPQPTEDQEPGRGRQDQAGDPESQALSPSAYHQALSGVVDGILTFC